MSQPILPFLLPFAVQKRGMRLSALMVQRKKHAARGLPQKKLPAANNPKRDPTTYGIPQRESDPALLARPQPGDNAAYDTHPLWQFFRNKQSIEAPHGIQDHAGRSWRAPELRAKSFEDLHKLWFILIKERNLLYTQRREFRSNSIPDEQHNTAMKIHRCRKGMARIKYVLNERRRAALEAGQILAKERAEQRIALEADVQRAKKALSKKVSTSEEVTEEEANLAQAESTLAQFQEENDPITLSKRDYNEAAVLYEALPTPKANKERRVRPVKVKVRKPKLSKEDRRAQLLKTVESLRKQLAMSPDQQKVAQVNSKGDTKTPPALDLQPEMNESAQQNAV